MVVHKHPHSFPIMAVKAKQFIELEFTGRIKGTSEIFDTTSEKDAKALGAKEKVKPLKICVGEGMLLEKFDRALEGKEAGKEYSIELDAKDAFGERKKELVKMIPLRIFTEKGVMPYRGLLLDLDGIVVRVVSVSGGRVIADFNNPLAGKSIVYDFKISRIIEGKKEQLMAFLESFLNLDASKLCIEIEDSRAVIEFSLKDDEFELCKNTFEKFSQKAKDILGLGIELKNNSPGKDEKK